MNQALADAIVRTCLGKDIPLHTREGRRNILYLEDSDRDGRPLPNNPLADKFNDQQIVLGFKNKRPHIYYQGAATCEPGKYYTHRPLKKAGAARLRRGFHPGAWQVGWHRGKHKALVQTGAEVAVWRDKNKDFEPEGDELDVGKFGINQHGPDGHDEPLDEIGRHSAGCLVAESMDAHRAFMDAALEDEAYRHNKRHRFDTTLLRAADLDWSGGDVVVEPAKPPPPAAPGISKRARDLIIKEEVSSKRFYNKRYRRPTWPGGGSGVTIGIGYDIGAGVASSEQLLEDWGDHLTKDTLAALTPCIGVTGRAAERMAARVRGTVVVPWTAAVAVFEKVTLPRYYAMCVRSLPNFEELSLDCRGALVSLVYNRGASFSLDGSRYREMRAIKRHMREREFDKIPDEIRAMKRIWRGKGLRGLLSRRDREAKLFERGLRQPAAVIAPIGAGVAGAGTAIATVATVTAGQHQGFNIETYFMIAAAVLLVGAIAYVAVRLKRDPASDIQRA